MISVKWNAGFFSCCSVRLTHIIRYMNEHKKLPSSVDNRQSLKRYTNRAPCKDVTFDYFEYYNKINIKPSVFNIDFGVKSQFKVYSTLNYNNIKPLVKKYFSPSNKINERLNTLKKKYDIDYENTVAVYYRGTDKKLETKLASFDEFYKKIKEIIKKNENIKILLQTDTKQFVDYINNKELKNVIIISENKTSNRDCGIHHEQTSNENYLHMINFLSTVLIISNCKYIICSSGNCSLWMILYRGNGKNIIQYLNGNWHSSIC